MQSFVFLIKSAKARYSQLSLTLRSRAAPVLQTSNIQPIFEGSAFYTSLNVCVTGPCSVCRSGRAQERLQGSRGVVGDQRYVSCLSKRHAMLPYSSSLLLCGILLSVRSALQKESALFKFKFKTPAVMTGQRGKYQNSPNQKCSFRPTTVKIYTSDFLH